MIGFSYVKLNPTFDENELWDENNLKFMPLVRNADGSVDYPRISWIKTNVKAWLEDRTAPVNVKEPIYLRF